MQTRGTGLGSKHLYIARSPHQTASEERILLTEGCWEAGVEQIHGLELAETGQTQWQKLTPGYWPGVMPVCSVAGRATRQARESVDKEV